MKAYIYYIIRSSIGSALYICYSLRDILTKLHRASLGKHIRIPCSLMTARRFSPLYYDKNHTHAYIGRSITIYKLTYSKRVTYSRYSLLYVKSIATRLPWTQEIKRTGGCHCLWQFSEKLPSRAKATPCDCIAAVHCDLYNVKRRRLH